MWTGFAKDRASVVMSSDVADRLAAHLARADGQEDLCFVLWRPSLGHERASALVVDVVLPEPGERHLHGTVSFEGDYFLRSALVAREAGCGVGLIHSHPGGRGWQGLSTDDELAESGHAAQAEVLTGLPMLGLTLGTGSNLCSARFWRRTGTRQFEPWWCETVRVVGRKYRVNYNPAACPAPPSRSRQVRTVSAWGDSAQADLARIRVGIIGAGSVGALVGESLARMGMVDITLVDFDVVEEKNLDRLLHAIEEDAREGRPKVDVIRRGLLKSATAATPQVRAIQGSLVEPDVLSHVRDLDVLFCCVDRPWARQVANYLAYVHLIPVIDGGVSVDAGRVVMRGAEWRAHVAAPGRRCLECLGQFDPADVVLERTGLLDDPRYIKELPIERNPLGSGENVFAFAAAAAAAEVVQFLSMVIGPAGQAQIPAQVFHFSTGTVDFEPAECRDTCIYSGPWFAQGDSLDVTVTGHDAAAAAIAARVLEAGAPEQVGVEGVRGRVTRLLRRVSRLAHPSARGVQDSQTEDYDQS